MARVVTLFRRGTMPHPDPGQSDDDVDAHALQGPGKATTMPTWSQMSRRRSRLLLIPPTLQSKSACPGSKLMELRKTARQLTRNVRVAPELKSQISSGKIDLTAIVNTHQ